MKDLKNNIEEILKKHGKRKQPDDLMNKRAMKNVNAHWQSSLNKKQHTLQKPKQTFIFRIAASIMLMVSTVLLVQYNLQGSKQAIVNDFYAIGNIQISNDGINWRKGQQVLIESDIWIKTNTNSYATITLLDNSQLRMNHDTNIHFINSSEIALISGQLYHDADNTTDTLPLTINTTLGKVQHIGTRYLVSKNDNDLQISVRNGLVQISNDMVKRKIHSGKKFTFNHSGTQTETPVSKYGSLWNWTQQAGYPFLTKGKTLNDFVTWYAHENGFKINWNNLQGQTKRVQLTGNISDLTATQQIKTIFLSTKFDYQINQGILNIL